MKTKLVPFDIEKAKNGAKVVTRDGHRVKITAHYLNTVKTYPITGEIKETGESLTFTKEGRFSPYEATNNDLFIEEEIENNSKNENKNMKTKLIPFDYEKAKAGAKVITRCGYPVTIIGCNSNKKYPIRAIIKTEDGPFTFSFTVEGKYCVDEEEHELDFFIEEEDVEAEEEEEVEETDNYDPYKATVESIADMVERYADADSDLQDFYDNVKVQCKDAVEYDKKWCKKQDEQKTSDSFEISPDKWYLCTRGACLWLEDGINYTSFMEGVSYLGADILKCNLSFEHEFYQKYYFRPWTIQDAKPGDILVNYSIIFIGRLTKDGYVAEYCHVNINNGKFYDTSNKCFIRCSVNDVITPATKEQCDLLVQKMKEAGYQWDSDKKELHKIEEVKKRRMTNQELAWWLRDCFEEHREFMITEDGAIFDSHIYYIEETNEPVKNGVVIRKNGGEWMEPLIEE